MSITAQWLDDDQQILLFEFVGVWTWDEYWTYMRSSVIDGFYAVEYPIYVIIDLTQGDKLPKNSLQQIRAARRLQLTAQHMMIVVTTDVFNRRLIELTNSLLLPAQRMTLVPNRSAALELIVQDRLQIE